VQRSTNGTSWTTIANVGANVTSYTTSKPGSGKTYYFRILAYNSAGNSAPSNVIKVTASGISAASVLAALASAPSYAIDSGLGTSALSSGTYLAG
jgi:hypothetical protein